MSYKKVEDIAPTMKERYSLAVAGSGTASPRTAEEIGSFLAELFFHHQLQSSHSLEGPIFSSTRLPSEGCNLHLEGECRTVERDDREKQEVND